MSVFLFVIDGFGIWNDKKASTFENLKNLCGIECKDIPFLSQIGLEYAIKGKGNLLSPLSVVPGSLEGHREMMGYISKDVYDMCPEKLPSHINNALYRDTNIKFVGNIKGRGRYIVPQYANSLENKNVLLYLGFDSTVSIAYRRNDFTLESMISYADKLMEILHNNSVNVRKIIVRQYDNDFKKISDKKEIFKKINFDDIIKELGFSKVIINSKIQDILRLSCAEIKNCNRDNECFDFLNNIKSDGFYFLNFPDFDFFAHQGNIDACMQTLIRFDIFIKNFWTRMKENDFIMITGDHGVRFKDSDLSNTHVLEDVAFLCLDKNGYYCFDGKKIGFDNIYKTIWNIQKKKLICDNVVKKFL